MAFKGHILRAWRQEKKLLLSEMASILNITTQHLSCLERSLREPSVTVLEKIISTTRLKFGDLISPSNPTQPHNRGQRGKKQKAAMSCTATQQPST